METKFEVAKHVTLPLFKIGKEPLFCRFESKIVIGKIVDDKKEPPRMAQVTNMETGELGEIIVGIVLKTNLEENYPDGTYVGKIFRLEKISPEGARKYSLYNITEMKVKK